MGGKWKLNPFYWTALRRLSHAKATTTRSRGANFILEDDPYDTARHHIWYYLNPLRWSRRAIRVFAVGFFVIMLPIYVFIGLQPASVTEALEYHTLVIDSIHLSAPVTEITMNDRKLNAPANIAGIYHSAAHKHFIIGHSATVFKTLHNTSLSDHLTYDGQEYRVTNIEILEKSSVDMFEILKPTEIDTIIIMTCAGDPLPNQDATHRLIITATAI